MSPKKKFPWVQGETPTIEEGLEYGDLWIDTATPIPIISTCINIAPVQFAVSAPPKCGLATSGADGNGSVVFGTPFISDGYTVQLTTRDNDTSNIYVGSTVSKTVNGFTFRTRNKNGALHGNVIVAWLATLNQNF